MQQTTTSERDIVTHVKETLAFVASDPDAAMAQPTQDCERSYELPDGQVIVIGNERWRCAEVLFAPSLHGSLSHGLAELVFGAIQRCSIDVRAAMWHNIVLSGGSSRLHGLAERLAADMRRLAPASMAVKVIAPPERAQSAWIGGSILGSLSTFETTTGVSRAEYDAEGPAAVHRKCCDGGYICYASPMHTAGGSSKPSAPSPTPSMAAAAPPPSAPAAAAAPTSPPSPKPSALPAPTAAKTDDVAIQQRRADTNSVLIQVGRLVMDATAAMAAGTVSRAMNEAVPPTLMHVTATALPVVEHYLISAPSQLATAKMEVPTAPMVIFCVDCSGSMGMLCKPSADARSSVTRLQCMQQALLEQICVLEAQQPECLVALVAFSSHVDVLTDTGRMVTAEAHQMRSLTAALETGVGHRTQVRQPVAQAARMLRERATLLRSGGATALGPALAIAIGLAKAPGSRVLVLTDGLANTGIGAIQQGRAEPFYMDVASRAADSGVSVSVLTLEGEDCSMENLGTTADVTGGAVEVFDPCEMGGKVASVMQRKTLATGVKCTLTMPEGVHARTEEVGSSAAQDPKGPSSVVHLSCASVTEESELTVRFGCDGPPEQLCHQKASDPTSIDADAWEMVRKWWAAGKWPRPHLCGQRRRACRLQKRSTPILKIRHVQPAAVGSPFSCVSSTLCRRVNACSQSRRATCSR